MSSIVLKHHEAESVYWIGRSRYQADFEECCVRREFPFLHDDIKPDNNSVFVALEPKDLGWKMLDESLNI